MTLLEAAKQSLDALELCSCSTVVASWNLGGKQNLEEHAHSVTNHEIVLKSIAELRQAIEQAEKQEPVAYWNGKDMFKRADEVQYVTNWTDYYFLPLYATPHPCQTCESLARTVMMDQTSHDTVPPESDYHEGWEEGFKAGKRESEPEKQEPMFWYRPLRDSFYEGPIHNNSVLGKMLRDEKPDEWRPLYTAPQQREWASLTDEDIEYIWGTTKPDAEDKFDFPRAIEAKLKEKNT